MKPTETAAVTGSLFVVGTPIGNLKDVTARMKEVLATAALIAAEDTRRTRNLLSHFGISAKLISCHEHNEAAVSGKIVGHLSEGLDVALVSDAGTPVLSDPGRRTVEAVRKAGFRIVPIPGPSAVTTALSVSGMPADQFFFQGFLPAKRSARIKRLEELSGIESTLVFFEAPHRMSATLTDMLSHLGDRETFMARELTKLHETLYRGKISDLLQLVEEQGIRGEITLVVSGADSPRSGSACPDMTVLEQIAEGLSSGQKMPTKQAASLLSSITGMPKNSLYSLLVKIKGDSH